MIEVSPDLKVTQPTVTLISNTFVKIENYLSIITYDTNLIKIKTKAKTVKITGAAVGEQIKFTLNLTPYSAIEVQQ